MSSLKRQPEPLANDGHHTAGRTTLQTGNKKRVIRKTKRDGVRQYSVHLHEIIHRDTKIALLMQGGKQDFSSLVEELLKEYLAKRMTLMRD